MDFDYKAIIGKFVIDPKIIKDIQDGKKFEGMTAQEIFGFKNDEIFGFYEVALRLHKMGLFQKAADSLYFLCLTIFTAPEFWLELSRNEEAIGHKNEAIAALSCSEALTPNLSSEAICQEVIRCCVETAHIDKAMTIVDIAMSLNKKYFEEVKRRLVVGSLASNRDYQPTQFLTEDEKRELYEERMGTGYLTLLLEIYLERQALPTITGWEDHVQKLNSIKGQPSLHCRFTQPKDPLLIGNRLMEGIYSQAYSLHEKGSYEDAEKHFRLLAVLNALESKYILGIAACGRLRQQKYYGVFEMIFNILNKLR